METANRFSHDTCLIGHNSIFRAPAAEEGSAFLAWAGPELRDILSRVAFPQAVEGAWGGAEHGRGLLAGELVRVALFEYLVESIPSDLVSAL